MRNALPLLLSILFCSLAALLGACGGGGGALLAESAPGEITHVVPTAAFALEETPFRIGGTGLPDSTDDPIVRLTALSGTPFEGGTRAFLDITPSAATGFAIEGVIPVTEIKTAFVARVEVVYDGGIIAPQLSETIEFRPQSLQSLDTPSVAADTPTRITLRGVGLHPVGRTAEVTFVPLPGSGFVGAGTITMPATITSTNTVTVFTPSVRVLEEARAELLLTLPSGAQMTTPPSAAITITPVPFLQSGSPGAVFAKERTPFRLIGYGFQKSDEDGEEQAVLELIARAGTPFDGGRAKRLELPVAVLDGNTLEARLPSLELDTVVEVQAVLHQVDGSRIVASDTVLRINPQVLREITPSRVTLEDTGKPISVGGSGFVPGSGPAILRLRADEGTPFLQGTTDVIEIPMTLSGLSSAQGTLPALRAWQDAQVSLELELASGLVLSGGDVRLDVVSRYAAFDADAPQLIGSEPATAVGVADFDVDGTADLVFSHADRGPYVYLNDGTANFPLELREEVSGSAGRRLFAANFDFQAAFDFLQIAGEGTGGGDDDGPGPKPLPEVAGTSQETKVAPEPGLAAAAGPHRIHRNDGRAFFPSSSSFGPTSSGTPVAEARADVDGDGRLDLLIAYEGDRSRAVELWRDRGFGSMSFFSRRTTSLVNLPTDLTGIAGADFNGDGRMDLALLSRGGGLSIWRQTSREEFVQAATFDVALGRTLEVADLDGDGDPDLIAGTDSDVTVLENRTRATFGFVARPPLSADFVNRLVIVDLDGDGDSDILVARGEGKDSRSLLLFDNEGALQFADSGLRTKAAVVLDVALADTDGDGLKDLVTAGPAGKHVLRRRK